MKNDNKIGRPFIVGVIGSVSVFVVVALFLWIYNVEYDLEREKFDGFYNDMSRYYHDTIRESRGE